MATSAKVVRLSDVRGVASGSTARAAVDDATVVRALRVGEPWAQRALLERHTTHVERILTRILGTHADLDDLIQDVFIRTFERVHELREPEALRGWLTSIAVYVAREAIRRRRRRKWLVFLPLEETPEIEIPAASIEARAALRAFYRVIEDLAPDARVAFTLRFVEEMELTAIAAACGVSLATIKRRIKAAEAQFLTLGKAHESLVDWFEGRRWHSHGT